MRPHRRQPTRLPHPWDSPGKNTGLSCHFLLQCMKVKSESEVAQSCPTLSDPWTAAYQAPPSIGFSRQEYWRGVPLSSLVALLGGSMVRLMATSSKKIYATCSTSQFCCSQSPCCRGRPLLICASTGDTQTLKGRSESVSVRSGAHQVLFELSERLWQV